MEMFNDCPNRRKVTFDLQLRGSSGPNTGLSEIGGLKGSGDDDWVFGMLWEQSNPWIRFRCGPQAGSVARSNIIDALSADTDYNIRVNVDGTNGQCDVYVDLASSNDWGTGDVYKICASGCDEGQLDSTDTWTVKGISHVEESGQSTGSVIDNLGLCDATAGFTPAGTKCGRDTPVATPTASPTATPTGTPTATPTPTPTPEPGLLLQLASGLLGLAMLDKRRRRARR
jgi:hypothetical protein